jgi:hypothetical protein
MMTRNVKRMVLILLMALAFLLLACDDWEDWYYEDSYSTTPTSEATPTLFMEEQFE